MKEIRLRQHDLAVLAAVKAYIGTLPDPMPTIVGLSRKFGINTDKLKKGFRQVYGVAPYRYVLRVRMAHAKELLRDTELTVAEIAFLLGYEYAENFSAWFRRETGLRPLEWRYQI